MIKNSLLESREPLLLYIIVQYNAIIDYHSVDHNQILVYHYSINIMKILKNYHTHQQHLVEDLQQQDRGQNDILCLV